MLVDHAQAQRMRVLRVGDRLFAVTDQDVALRGVVVAHDAFHERALAGAVFAEQSVQRAGPNLQFDIVERDEIAEPHRHCDGIDAERAGRRGIFAYLHEIAPIRSADLATAPNTPPCILIILMACSWLLLSVAAQQSSTSTHSKPRSLASRMVVCTQTSVVMPVKTMFSMPRRRSISSRSVAQNEPLPGLSMIGSPATGARSGMISQPNSPRTRMRPHGPGSPIPAPIWRERQRLLAGKSARSGRCPSRVWMM